MRHHALSLLATLGLVLGPAPAAFAQVTTNIATDGTTGPAETITADPGTSTYTIDDSLGDRPGGGVNLFHSFLSFDLGAGDTADFTASSGLPTERVISRVTGGDPSEIEGTLKSSIPGADFYFLNPAGVMFGEGASLDVQGSFHASSADQLKLRTAGGTELLAFSGDAALATAAPSAFGFLGAAPASITVAGANLQPPAGAGLSLVGGEVQLGSGDTAVPETRITLNGGRLSIVSVAKSGDVTITEHANGLELTPDPADPGRSIALERARLAVDGAGEISLQAGTIDLFDATPPPPRATGSAPDPNEAEIFSTAGAGIVLHASELQLDGASILSLDGAAAGGDIHVAAESVTLVNGATLEAVAGVFLGTDGQQGGDVTLTAAPSGGTTRLALSGGSLIDTDSLGMRVSGDVTIQGFEEVALSGLSQIRSDAYQGARTGNVTITGAESIELSERSEISSGAFTGSNRELPPDVEPGKVTLEADTIELKSGGSIESISVAAGDGGDIEITTDKLIAEGAFIDPPAPPPPPGLPPEVNLSQPSGVSSTIGFAFNQFVENHTGGDVTIHAREIKLANGGRIAAETIADGIGGKLFIEADRIRISGVNEELAAVLDAIGIGEIDPGLGSVLLQLSREEDFAHSAIATSSLVPVDAVTMPPIPLGPGGAAGAITLRVGGSLVLKDGGLVAAFSEGQGDAGDITINPNDPDPDIDDTPGRIEIDGGAAITTEAEQASGGVVTLRARTFAMHNGSVTTSVETGVGGGGNVTVTAGEVALNTAEIRANADAGNGGNISIDAGNYIATPDTIVTASSNTGIDGVITITSPDVNVEAGLTQLQVEFAGASSLLRPSCAVRSGDAREGSFVVAKRRGVPNSPEDLLLAFDAVGGATGVASTSGAEAKAQAAGAGAKAATVASLAAANAFRGGDLELAEANYAEAAKLLAASGGDAKEQGVALRGLAQTQQAAGRYAASLETLRGAVNLAEKSEDRAGLASALGGLGNAYVALGRGAEAAPLLQRGIAIATESGDTALAAGLWNNLGNQHATEGAFADAGSAYEQAAKLAAASGDPLAETKALANAAHAALDAGQPERAGTLLSRAETRIDALPTSAERASLRIHAAHVWANLASGSPALRRQGLLSAHRLLTAALEEAQALGAERTRSFALGNLGALYQSEGHRDEALLLTRQAIRSAEAADAPEALYRWYWQEGQLLRDQGDTPAALASYRRAIEVLEETREEAQGRYGAAAAYFRRAVAPVYLEMVDLLLTRADSMPVGGPVLLAEARSTMEQFKAAELRDYYRDECVAELAAKTTTLEDVARDAAVVYPIVLPERLELLVTLPKGLRRYAVDVSSQELSETVGRFRRALQDPGSDAHGALGRKLYDWLVRPYADDLGKARVSTLVFVPDGPLRTVPMAALSDGELYVAERWALAVTPSLALVDPHPLDRAGMQVLLGGVSESVEGFPALAMVPAELEAVSKRTGGEVLLDDDFGLRQVEQQIRETQPTVVHIASHAVFTGDPETSFVLLHDDKLTMDRLSSVVGVTKYRERPLELLVLSACETAAGDERAGLGLAGVAIRAGARSALGSLWPISDEAAFRLVDSFYEALQDPNVSKAQALQRAQAKLREDPRFAHPYFWSPFLIINNWL